MTGAAGYLDQGEHVMALRVYYEDTDAAGIVYYANYLKYAERARTDMLRLAGIEQRALAREQGIAFAVRHCAVDYQRPAYLDDLLEVRSTLIALGGATAEACQRVRRGGQDLVQLTVRLACISAEGRPARMPKALSEALGRYLNPSSHPSSQAGKRE